jgi:hypothetical protein
MPCLFASPEEKDRQTGDSFLCRLPRHLAPPRHLPPTLAGESHIERFLALSLSGVQGLEAAMTQQGFYTPRK